MSVQFANGAIVKFVYFHKEEVLQQKTIFEGTVDKWRSEVGKEWNGFDEGDSFLLNDDRVRVFQINESFDPTGQITEATYHIGLNDLNPNKIKYEKL